MSLIRMKSKSSGADVGPDQFGRRVAEVNLFDSTEIQQDFHALVLVVLVICLGQVVGFNVNHRSVRSNAVRASDRLNGPQMS